MRRLVFVRHGDYCDSESGGNLSGLGREQMTLMGQKLKATLNGGRIGLLTSTASRASQSAEIVGQIIGAEPEGHMLLWSGEQPEDFPGVLSLIRSKKDEVDTLVVITHFEYVEGFPYYFGKHELEVNDFPSMEIRKGEAWDINCEQKICNHIR